LIRMNILPWVSGSLVNEPPARIPAHFNRPATLPGYFPHVHGALLSTYSSWIGRYSTAPYRYIPLHTVTCKTLIRLNIFPWVSCSLVNELPARPPAHAILPGALPRYFPPVHGALLLTSSSRIGHHSTISYRYACKALLRLNISPLVSCSLVNELPARLPAHANLPGGVPSYFP